MIEHLVLFKWKADASPDAIASLVDALKGLKAQIPEILYLSCGDNFSDRSQGFQFGLIVRFQSRDHLEKIYQPHPAHQQVLHNLILPITADLLAVDYQVL